MKFLIFKDKGIYFPRNELDFYYIQDKSEEKREYAEIVFPQNLDDAKDFSKWTYEITSIMPSFWYKDNEDFYKEKFMEVFLPWAKENIAVDLELNSDSKNYSIYYKCTGSIIYNPYIDLIYDCDLTEISCSCVQRISHSIIAVLRLSNIINMIDNSNIDDLAETTISKSCYSVYNHVIDSNIQKSKTDSFIDIYASYLNNVHASTKIERINLDSCVFRNCFTKDDFSKTVIMDIGRTDNNSILIEKQQRDGWPIETIGYDITMKKAENKFIRFNEVV